MLIAADNTDIAQTKNTRAGVLFIGVIRGRRHLRNLGRFFNHRAAAAGANSDATAFYFG